MLADNRLNVLAFCYHLLLLLHPWMGNDAPPVSDYLLPPHSSALSRYMRFYRSIHLSVSVSSITMNAVLCLQVLGGRMLHTPCLASLQVIVIAPRLDVNRNLLLSIPHDKVSPFLRGRLAGRECLTKLCSSRGLDL